MSAAHIASLIDQYEAGAPRLSALSKGLSPHQLDTRIAPGTWSVREVIVHLLDSDLAATHRMRRIASEELPLIIAYDESAFADALAYSRTDLSLVHDLFLANRRFCAAWLRTLPPEAFDRAGIHNQRGKVTLAQMVQGYIDHLAHHEKFVAGKRAALSV